MDSREIAESIVRDALLDFRTRTDLSPISNQIANSPDPRGVAVAIADVMVADVTTDDLRLFKHFMHAVINEVPALEGMNFYHVLHIAENNKTKRDLDSRI